VRAAWALSKTTYDTTYDADFQAFMDAKIAEATPLPAPEGAALRNGDPVPAPRAVAVPTQQVLDVPR
jgi:hypothetical protein